MFQVWIWGDGCVECLYRELTDDASLRGMANNNNLVWRHSLLSRTSRLFKSPPCATWITSRGRLEVWRFETTQPFNMDGPLQNVLLTHKCEHVGLTNCPHHSLQGALQPTASSTGSKSQLTYVGLQKYWGGGDERTCYFKRTCYLICGLKPDLAIFRDSEDFIWGIWANVEH